MKNLEDQEWGEGRSSPPYAPKAQKVKPSAPPVTQTPIVLTGQIHDPAEVTGETLYMMKSKSHTQ